MINLPDRSTNKCTDELITASTQFILMCNDSGYPIFITEAWRSTERQGELYAQGRTTPGAVCTWTLDSMHCTGQAIDIAFNLPNIYPDDIELWRSVSYIAWECGLEWGYDLWGIDRAHFQLITTNNDIMLNANLTEAIKLLEYAAKNLYNVSEIVNGPDKARTLASDTATRCRELTQQ